MAFQPGHKKFGGRRKGTPNSKTTNLNELLDKHNCSLPLRILELIPKLEPKDQAKIYLDLMAYVYPKRKAVESNLSLGLPESSKEQQTQIEELSNRLERITGISPGSIRRAIRIGQMSQKEISTEIERLQEDRLITEKEIV